MLIQLLSSRKRKLSFESKFVFFFLFWYILPVCCHMVFIWFTVFQLNSWKGQIGALASETDGRMQREGEKEVWCQRGQMSRRSIEEEKCPDRCPESRQMPRRCMEEELRSTNCRLAGSLLHKFSAFTQISLSNAGSRACFSGGRIYNRSSAGGGGGG